jgi:hypothetical protein
MQFHVCVTDGLFLIKTYDEFLVTSKFRSTFDDGRAPSTPSCAIAFFFYMSLMHHHE